MTLKPVHVIGGGLAGSEAAWHLAQAGVPVVLHEMRPQRATAAHKTDGSPNWSARIRSAPTTRTTTRSACCMRRCAGSARWSCARPTGTRCRPAARWRSTATDFPPLLRRRCRAAARSRSCAAKSRCRPQDWDNVIIATGPLTSPDLAATIRALTGEDALAFFDAIAPIVHRDLIDLDQAWFQSRYDKTGPGGSGADYINCPLSREQYDAFIDALLAGDKTVFHDWESPRPISTAVCRSK